MLSKIAPALLAFPALLLLADNAYAYLDPGTGSILLQGLIGAIAGGLFMVRLYWSKLKALFLPRARKAAAAESHPEAEEDR